MAVERVPDRLRCLPVARFWPLYEELPAAVRRLADKSFQLLKADPRHPALRFKKIGRLWSARVGAHYRALATEE